MIKYDKRKFDAYQIPGVERIDFRDDKDPKKNGVRFKYWLIGVFILIVIMIIIIAWWLLS